VPLEKSSLQVTRYRQDPGTLKVPVPVPVPVPVLRERGGLHVIGTSDPMVPRFPGGGPTTGSE